MRAHPVALVSVLAGLAALLGLGPVIEAERRMTVRRFVENPIISPALFAQAGVPADGENINGPTLIRVPEWLPNRLGRYYLYFGHHGGTYIRLAYADDLRGPWKLYRPGRGVLAMEADRTLRPGKGIEVHGHIASPDAHVDEANRRIILYFHGPARVEGKGVGQQKTLVATSSDGLDFNGRAEPALLGESYFRVFRWREQLYAFCNRATLYRARDPSNPGACPPSGNMAEDAWERGPNPIAAQIRREHPGTRAMPRHVAVKLDGDLLTVFFSRVDETAIAPDQPERILVTQIRLTGDWKEWRAGPIQEVLRPETPYEGTEYPVVSRTGGQVRVCQLRDPAYFEDTDGKSYLLYSLAGEMGIAIAELP